MKTASYCSKMSVTSPAKPQVIAIESVPRQYSYAALAFMQIASGGSAGSLLLLLTVCLSILDFFAKFNQV